MYNKKVKLKYVIAILIPLIIIAGYFVYINFFLVSKQPTDLNFSLSSKPEVVFNKKIILNVEIVRTPTEMEKGLGYRKSLASDAGMIFIYDQPVMPVFWMKGMEFPLDFIWVTGNKIVDLTENVPNLDPSTPDNNLPRYSPQEPVDKVIEVNAGWIKSNNLKIGDEADLRLLE